jgi:hypothetical protein
MHRAKHLVQEVPIYLSGVLNGTLSTTSGPTTGTGNFHIGSVKNVRSARGLVTRIL